MEAKITRSKLLLFSILGLLVSGALIGGAFYIRDKSIKDNQFVPTSTPGASPTETPIETLPPTATSTLTPTPSPTPTVTPAIDKPQISTPLPNTKVISPLVVKGIAPTGWMFEGQLVIKLLDAQRNVIVQVAGKEITPGSWQSGDPVPFEGTLTFTTNQQNVFLVIENDNPSGLPANSKTFEIPLQF
jgi:hypothetical protein